MENKRYVSPKKIISLKIIKNLIQKKTIDIINRGFEKSITYYEIKIWLLSKILSITNYQKPSVFLNSIKILKDLNKIFFFNEILDENSNKYK